jgi:hypothetical protein
MLDITQQRCRNHVKREAVACCPGCSRYFCRECITEHEDRVLCAACIRSLVEAIPKKSLRFQGLIRSGQFLLGLLILYILFYYFAEILLAIPTEFHEGTLWKADWWSD